MTTLETIGTTQVLAIQGEREIWLAIARAVGRALRRLTAAPVRAVPAGTRLP